MHSYNQYHVDSATIYGINIIVGDIITHLAQRVYC